MTSTLSMTRIIHVKNLFSIIYDAFNSWFFHLSTPTIWESPLKVELGKAFVRAWASSALQSISPSCWKDLLLSHHPSQKVLSSENLLAHPLPPAFHPPPIAINHHVHPVLLHQGTLEPAAVDCPERDPRAVHASHGSVLGRLRPLSRQGWEGGAHGDGSQGKAAERRTDPATGTLKRGRSGGKIALSANAYTIDPHRHSKISL